MFLYNRGKAAIGDGVNAWLDAQIVAILVGDGYTPSPDHDFIADIVAHEVAGFGYARGFGASGRRRLLNKSVVVDDDNDLSRLDADDIAWVGLNVGTVKGIVLAQQKTSDANSPLWAYIDGGPFPTATNGGRLSITWPAAGIITLT